VPEDERAQAPLTGTSALDRLAAGEVEVRGRMPWSSNATFLAEVRCGPDDDPMLAVYKPGRGERPLWDFPRGLYRREVAAYVLSSLLGWGLVPETVLRATGPLGPGSLQRFVPADFEQHHFTLVEDPAHHAALRRIAVFDILANNTDRKSGHCLLGTDGRIYAIDNGLCFHPEPKLRTVIWEFAGSPIDDTDLAGVAALLDRLPGGLDALLDDEELGAVRDRAERVLAHPVLPEPDPYGRAYPWPLV
jgi:uncharacterized repeat protein (TIGR03843 family)